MIKFIKVLPVLTSLILIISGNELLFVLILYSKLINKQLFIIFFNHSPATSFFFFTFIEELAVNRKQYLIIRYFLNPKLLSHTWHEFIWLRKELVCHIADLVYVLTWLIAWGHNRINTRIFSLVFNYLFIFLTWPSFGKNVIIIETNIDIMLYFLRLILLSLFQQNSLIIYLLVSIKKIILLVL